MVPPMTTSVRHAKRLFTMLSLALLPLATMGADGNGCGGGGDSNNTDGGETPDGCFPQCFLDLMAPCTPVGACAQSTSSSGTSAQVNACYANGVKAATQTNFSGTSFTSHLTYYKADGSVCFTGDGATDASGNTTTYKNAAGQTVLTVQAPVGGTGVMTYTCGGKTYQVDPSSAACQGHGDGGSGGCTDGACTIP